MRNMPKSTYVVLLQGLGVFLGQYTVMDYPRAPSYPNGRLRGYGTIGYMEARTHYLGNWSPRVSQK